MVFTVGKIHCKGRKFEIQTSIISVGDFKKQNDYRHVVRTNPC